MAYDATKPLDNGYLADAPAELRELFRALKEDKIVNAGQLNGYTQGNASGNIPLNNGTVNTNLNADLLDGHDSAYFSAATHGHDDATTNASGFMSATDKTKLNGIATGAEVNQNAFSNVTVGNSTIQADGKTDTLTLVAGTGITLTADTTNDKVTIKVTDNTYAAASHLHDYVLLSGGTMTGRLIVPAILSQTIGNVRTKATGNYVGIVIKDASASSDATPNNGIVIETYRNNSNYGGQLFLGDNDSQRPAVNGWSNGTYGEWKPLAYQSDISEALSGYLPLSGGTVTGSLTVNNSLSSNSFINMYTNTGTNNNYRELSTYAGSERIGNVRFWKRENNNTLDVYAQKTINGSNMSSGISLTINANGTATGSFLGALFKLGTSTVGSATKPVYVNAGTITAGTYELKKTVPADAVFTDTVYTHPTTAGNKHIPAGGSSGQYLKWSAAGTAVWAALTAEIVASSIASNGYKKFASGLIIQWGKITPGSSTAVQTITFPTAFASEAYGVVFSECQSTSNTANAGGYSFHDLTKTNFKHRVVTGPSYIFWIAFGK